MRKLRLNVNKMDRLILCLLMLQLFFLGFLGLTPIMNKIMTVLILGWIFLRRKAPDPLVFLNICCLAAFFVISAICSSRFDVSNGVRNFVTQLYPFVYAYFFYYLCENNPDLLDDVLAKGFPWFNLALIANYIALYFQIFYPGKLVAVHTIADKSLFVDTLSGFFSYSYTHVLCMFLCFMVIYNTGYAKKTAKSRVQKAIYVYTGIIFASCIVLAVLYDNKAILYILPVCMYLYSVIADRGNIYAKKFFFGILIVFASMAACTWIPALRNFVIESFFRRILEMLSDLFGGNLTLGSSERLAMIGYALMHPRTYLFGTGWGSSYIYDSGYLGFVHFGQSDFGSFLILGGIWYSFLSFVFYYRIYVRIVKGNQPHMRLWPRIVILMLHLLCILYTQTNSNPEIQLSLILVMLAFRLANTTGAANNKRALP